MEYYIVVVGCVVERSAPVTHPVDQAIVLAGSGCG